MWFWIFLTVILVVTAIGIVLNYLSREAVTVERRSGFPYPYRIAMIFVIVAVICWMIYATYVNWNDLTDSLRF